MSSLFITGTDTGVGKTVVSAILTLNMNLVYWKPIQCGLDEETDTEFIKRVTKLAEHNIIQELFRLKLPRSPHEAAEAEGLEIHSRNFSLPEIQSKKLLIEGAGGLLVPLHNQLMVVDFIRSLQAKVILVSRNYLGSINHTILSIEALKHRKIPIAGIVINGEPNPATESFIENYSQGVTHSDRTTLFKQALVGGGHNFGCWHQ